MRTLLGKGWLQTALTAFALWAILPEPSGQGRSPFGPLATFADEFEDDDDDATEGRDADKGRDSDKGRDRNHGSSTGDGGDGGGGSSGGDDDGGSDGGGSSGGDDDGGDDDGGDDGGDDGRGDEGGDDGAGAKPDGQRKVVTQNYWDSARDHDPRVREMLAVGADDSTLVVLRKLGFRVEEQKQLHSLDIAFARLTIPASMTAAEAFQVAAKMSPKTFYESNSIYRLAADAPGALGVPDADDCASGTCVAFQVVGWPAAPDACGAGLRIGMADTGLDLAHPALAGRSIVQHRASGSSGPSIVGHGTAVAAVLVGNAETGFPGMLPSATLFAVDVFRDDGSGLPEANLADLLAGLDWLSRNEVSVINISMTGPHNLLLERAIDQAGDRGATIVAAAGNGGPSAQPAYPAAYEKVVSVTAVDAELRPYRMANRGDYISFASPGVDVWSADQGGRGRFFTGTSLAAAHVSAVVAESMARSTADADVALAALRETARDLGKPGKDSVFGWGLVQSTPACGT